MFAPRHQFADDAIISNLSYPVVRHQKVSTLTLVLLMILPCILMFGVNGIILKIYDPSFISTAFLHQFHLMLRAMLFSQAAAFVCHSIIYQQ